MKENPYDIKTDSEKFHIWNEAHLRPSERAKQFYCTAPYIHPYPKDFCAKQCQSCLGQVKLRQQETQRLLTSPSPDHI